MIKTISIFLVIFFSMLKAQSILYHEYEPTASNYKIIGWNVDKNKLPVFYLMEIVDEEGRVNELRFMKEKEYLPDPLCYLPTKVNYEYSDNIIIVYYFFGNEIAYYDECENYFKQVYHLNKDNKISLAENFYEFDTINFSKEEIQEMKTLIACNLKQNGDSVSLFIDFYEFSFAKMNNQFPVSLKFKLEDYYFGKEELKEIKNSFNK